MDQPTVKASEGGLPAQLAASLQPELLDALANPIRREILRFLNAGGRARSEREIASELTEFTASEVSYHARVLERSGSIVIDCARTPSGGQQRFRVSDLAKDERVHSALRATQRFDRDHRKGAGRHSSRFLTMLRIPHPTISIRLGNREGGRSKKKQSEPKRQLADRPSQTATPNALRKALNHPLRRRILRTLHDVEEARSPGELSKALRLPVSHVSYHIQVLREKHAIALTDTRPVRGAVEHFYASTVAEDQSTLQFLGSTEEEDKSS